MFGYLKASVNVELRQRIFQKNRLRENPQKRMGPFLSYSLSLALHKNKLTLDSAPATACRVSVEIILFLIFGGFSDRLPPGFPGTFS
jgi:hypothetical protein